jgi:hypothetical protein
VARRPSTLLPDERQRHEPRAAPRAKSRHDRRRPESGDERSASCSPAPLLPRSRGPQCSRAAHSSSFYHSRRGVGGGLPSHRQ